MSVTLYGSVDVLHAIVQRDRIGRAMDRAFPLVGWDVCDWALAMTSATRTAHPCVRADRLRAAAEFRLGMAAELRKGKGREASFVGAGHAASQGEKVGV